MYSSNRIVCLEQPTAKKKLYYFVQLIILLSCLLFTGCSKETKEKTDEMTLQPPKENYDTIKVTKGDYVSTFSSKNVELVYDAVTVTSDKKTSKFSKFCVYKYDRVKEGDPIAVLDTEVSTVNMEEKQLAYKRVENQYLTDSKDMKHNLALQEQALEQIPEGVEKQIAAIKLEKAKAGYEQYVLQSERSLELQRKEMKRLEEEMEDNSILAPFDGLILEMSSLGKGEEVKPGDTICKLVPVDRILLGVVDRGDLRYDMKVTVTSKFGKKEEKYQGRVVYAKNVAPDGKWDNVTYIALENNQDPNQYIDLKNPSVEAEYISIKDVLLLKPSVISNDVNSDYVTIYDEDQVSKQYVVVGKSDKDKAWILQGLSENQSVIIN